MYLYKYMQKHLIFLWYKVDMAIKTFLKNVDKIKITDKNYLWVRFEGTRITYLSGQDFSSIRKFLEKWNIDTKGREIKISYFRTAYAKAGLSWFFVKTIFVDGEAIWNYDDNDSLFEELMKDLKKPTDENVDQA